jgi:CheY-like chemotaxis protein
MLPIHTDRAGSAAGAGGKEAPGAAGAKKEARGGTILLVDDDKGIRESISAFLKGLGYSVFTANDGLEAVEKYGDTHKAIDLVILDMVMPRMGGKDAFVKMKEINPAIKAIAITGFNHHSAQELLELGVKRIFHKPFSFDELSEAIAGYMAG